MRRTFLLTFFLFGTAFFVALQLPAQEAPDAAAEEGGSAVRGSLVEDRAARKLLEAGDTRYDSDEIQKAVEIWQSVIERYPRSRVRFDAHMRLGDYFLERDRSYDRARVHFQAVAAEENRDEEQRADATLKVGICFYEARNYGKCFQMMRDVIEQFPVSKQVNHAYYYIGLGHFQLGHYSRAIAALENVGTTLANENEKGKIEKVEAGKRLFVKIDDADLAALEVGQAVEVRCETTAGDVEVVKCFPLGRNVRVVLGTLPSRLGRPITGNGTLELKGDDKVIVTYTDQHTADKTFDRPVTREITVVGDAIVSITDGAYSESLRGVVLGKSVNIQISDPDRDLSDAADSIQALVEVYRQKTDEELEAEAAEILGKAAAANGQDGAAAAAAALDAENGDEGPKIDRYKKIDGLTVTLVEAKLEQPLSAVASAADAAADESAAGTTPGTASPNSADGPQSPGAEPPPIDDGTIHSGVFRAVVALERVEVAVADDAVLQALPGDLVRVKYLDERNTGEGVREIQAEARAVEGNLGGVRVTRAVISDKELRIQTQLKTASALTNIGNRYKEFGLKRNADDKYQQALSVCEEIMTEALRLGGRLLEETYVQLWQVYYEMDNLNLAAAMCQRLQRDFPNSGFVDDALLQLADVSQKQGDLQRAIGIYTRLVGMQTSQLRGEAQFGIAECYEKMATAADGPAAVQLFDRSFQEYKKVFDNYPDSGRVGESVAKMANYYYQQKDYARAVDTFESVLTNYPDAKFLDVILFNYGRCLYRMERKQDARQRFDQLIGDFPESPLAADAKKISDALAKAGF